jgi:hypothetical protein
MAWRWCSPARAIFGTNLLDQQVNQRDLPQAKKRESDPCQPFSGSKRGLSHGTEAEANLQPAQGNNVAVAQNGARCRRIVHAEESVRFRFNDQTFVPPINEKMTLPDTGIIQGQIQTRLAPGSNWKTTGLKNNAASISGKEMKLDHSVKSVGRPKFCHRDRSGCPYRDA